jgi:hypothetical protein
MDGKAMSNIRLNNHSFNGGEVGPTFYGQIGDAKYQTGLATARNFVCRPEGPAENRAGFRYVNYTKYPTPTRLLRFTFSVTQTMVIEMGHYYLRFHTQGGTLAGLSGAPYEVVTPYTFDEIFDIDYVQSNDVVTLVHVNHPPMELKRLGAINWTLTPVQFTPTILPPATVTATPNTTNTDYNFSYVVTAFAADQVTESAPSNPATCTNNVFITGGKNVITWAAVTGAAYYVVYKLVGGSYGYIGRTTSLTITDDNIEADLSRTPPIYDSLFQATGDYPGAVAYYEQRRMFAGSINKPQTVWGTRSGTESVMSYSLPTRADDRLSFRIAALESNAIRHLVPLSDLIAMTSSVEFRITSVNADALSPTDISAKPQSFVGVNKVQPLAIGSAMLYANARGGHIQEMKYSLYQQGFQSNDMSLRASHLFDNHTIVDMDYAKAPLPIMWAVSSSGKLLGLTYIASENVTAWHQHDTQGIFESCVVVSENDEDVLYVVTRRTIAGIQQRFVERQATRKFTSLADSYFVDCGYTYSGGPTTTVSTMTWLEGETVSILADGAVLPQQVVSGGTVTLPHPASIVHVGLPYTSDAQTLPVAAQIDGAFAQGRVKNVNRVYVRVTNSSGIFAGPNANRMRQFAQRTTEPFGSPPEVVTDEISIDVDPDWQAGGQVLIRQVDPLPVTIVSMAIEVTVGN